MPKQILIVDDSIISRAVIRRCLDMSEVRADKYLEAANGVEALTLLNTNDINLILTDLIMPEMDGEQLVIEIRQIRKYDKIPIVVISSIANPSYEAKLISLGAAAVVKKPFTPLILENIIKTNS